MEVVLERKQKYEVKKLDEVAWSQLQTKRMNSIKSYSLTSGRAGRDNTRRNETPSGQASERRVREEAGGEIRNETSCFDEGVAVGGVQCNVPEMRPMNMA